MHACNAAHLVRRCNAVAIDDERIVRALHVRVDAAVHGVVLEHVRHVRTYDRIHQVVVD